MRARRRDLAVCRQVEIADVTAAPCSTLIGQQGDWGAAQIILAFLIAAAVLESVFAICLGCRVFGLLMRFGVIPEEVCERCNNIWINEREAA